jgi:hypothetical protein
MHNVEECPGMTGKNACPTVKDPAARKNGHARDKPVAGVADKMSCSRTWQAHH